MNGDDLIGNKLSEPVTLDYGGSVENSFDELYGQFPPNVMKLECLNRRTKGTKNMQLSFFYVSILRSSESLLLTVRAQYCWTDSFCALIFKKPA
jgi:hypothetical protein